jgi:hypothetical protein
MAVELQICFWGSLGVQRARGEPRRLDRERAAQPDSNLAPGVRKSLWFSELQSVFLPVSIPSQGAKACLFPGAELRGHRRPRGDRE